MPRFHLITESMKTGKLALWNSGNSIKSLAEKTLEVTEGRPEDDRDYIVWVVDSKSWRKSRIHSNGLTDKLFWGNGYIFPGVKDAVKDKFAEIIYYGEDPENNKEEEKKMEVNIAWSNLRYSNNCTGSALEGLVKVYVVLDTPNAGIDNALPWKAYFNDRFKFESRARTREEAQKIAAQKLNDIVSREFEKAID